MCRETTLKPTHNKNKTTKWFRKAADQGHSLAKEALGKCYYELYIKTLDERYLRYCIKYYYNGS